MVEFEFETEYKFEFETENKIFCEYQPRDMNFEAVFPRGPNLEYKSQKQGRRFHCHVRYCQKHISLCLFSMAAILYKWKFSILSGNLCHIIIIRNSLL